MKRSATISMSHDLDTRNYNDVITLTGRVITGVGMGMAMGAPRIFITEISLPNMRGTVGALPNLAISLGLIFLVIIIIIYSRILPLMIDER